MSAEVKITQRGLFKRLPKFKELLMPDMKYGVMDEGYRLEEGETGEYTVVFFPDVMHRGFENVDKSKDYDAEHFLLTLSREDVEKLKKECKLCDI